MTQYSDVSDIQLQLRRLELDHANEERERQQQLELKKLELEQERQKEERQQQLELKKLRVGDEQSFRPLCPSY